MGPTSLVRVSRPLTEQDLASVDVVLAGIASILTRTRKGRVWAAQIQGRPVDISVEESDDRADIDQFRIVLTAGCNDPLDYDVLTAASGELATALRGRSNEPTK